MFKKFIKAVSVAALGCSVLALAACSSSSTQSEAITSAAESADTNAQSAVAESSDTKADSSAAGKKIVIVTGGDAEPYSLVHEDGSWTGIDADIWAEIEKRTGWEVELKKTSFDSIFGELDAGRADMAANCFATKAERLEKYYASIPYYRDAQAIAVSADNEDIKTFEDLKGKKVGFTSGQASQTIIEQMAKDIGFETVIYEQSNIGCQELSLGRIDAMASAVTVFNNYMNASGNKVRILDEKLLANNVAYFFPKTDDGAALRDEVDVVLKELLEDGTIGKITEKWLFEDMTKLINEKQ